MIMIEILENKRYFEAEDADYYISFKDGPKELPKKALKGMSVKRELFNGTLRVTEGEVLIQLKHATIYFSSSIYPYAYGIEFGKFFQKDLQLDTIIWKAADEIPKVVYDKLLGEKNEEAKEENNNEGDSKEEEKETPITESNSEEVVSGREKETPITTVDTEEKSEEVTKDETTTSNKEDETLDGKEEITEEDEKNGVENFKNLTKNDIFAWNKEQQVNALLALGIQKKDIPKYEKDRVEKLFEMVKE